MPAVEADRTWYPLEKSGDLPYAWLNGRAANPQAQFGQKGEHD